MVNVPNPLSHVRSQRTRSRPYGFCFLSDSDSTFLYIAERNASGGIEVRRVSYAAEVLSPSTPGRKMGMRFKFMTVALHLSDIVSRDAAQ